MIRCGLAEEYNYPVIQQMDIVWEKYQNISVTVQNPSGSLIVIVQNRESKNLFYSDLLLLCG